MRIERLALALVALCTAELVASSAFEFWPGASYDPRVPTHKQVLGHDPGERITRYAGLKQYLEALATATGRLRLVEYGTSWEGRKLFYAIIGSEASLRRLEQIRTGYQQLADPRRTPEAQARQLIEQLPAVVCLANGVHGNEISGPDAALLVAYHLLAARNDKLVEQIRENVVLLLVPSQNPDGRERFLQHYEQTLGLEPDANPAAAEHVEPWPGGRGNHYLFDLNRDWVPLTQPEIRGLVAELRRWFPLVFVDLHEMGPDATYYFAPEADPFNPHITREQREALFWFGRNNARWFDRFGFDYFTREVYDAFYPGYGASWPTYYGAVAMTYEQASARGLLMRRSDDRVFHFRDTVRQQFVSSIATLETAARERQKLLELFYRYRKTAIEEGAREPVREYILPRRGDTSAVDKLAAVLAEHGIELKRALAPFRNGNREFPAGSYVIPLAQPAKRLIRTLLDPHVPMDEKFLQEQERRRKKRLPDEIYDVTAWSLPLAYNVEAVAAAEESEGKFEPASPARVPPGAVDRPEAQVAFLVPWGTQAAARLLTAALREGLNILSSDKPFTLNGRRYPAGTLIVKVKDNPAGLGERMVRLARRTGAEVHGTDSSWVEEGVNFGSRHVIRMRAPAVAMAWDRPVSSLSAGWARFVLERQYEYPVSVIRTQTLAMADLSRYQVLILPDQAMGEGYAQVLGPNGIRRLREWVSGGGTVIGIAGAVSFLADGRTGLLPITQEYLARPGETARRTEPPKPEAAKPEAAAEPRGPGKLLASEEEYLREIQPERELPDPALGVMARARLDPDHWITAGLGETVVALVSGRAIYSPIKLDRGVNAAVFLGPDQLLASGYLWEENRKQLAYKPLLVVGREGRGYVIGFTADPNFRAAMDGLNVLFLNAIFRTPPRTRTAGLAGE
ncbi:MAG: M14 family metallopeptidase [Bryobacterales bacterium]|nr:M14 family metallopeptidase [Bryobacteraceae bacterium]MDW8130796.1 M14 family metallopeptidase [Bryobacterales bacterium]